MSYIKMPTKETSVNNLLKQVTIPDYDSYLSHVEKSEIIESTLLRIPTPSFYLSRLGQDEMVVWVGVKRLRAIRDFIQGEFTLVELTALKPLEGQSWKELPKHIQTRLKNTMVSCHIIEPDTDNDMLKYIARQVKKSLGHDIGDIID